MNHFKFPSQKPAQPANIDVQMRGKMEGGDAISLPPDFDPASAKPIKDTPIPKGSVRIGLSHIITQQQHDDLLVYLKARLDWAKPGHDRQIQKFTAIDREVSGFIRLDDADFQRKKDNEKGFGVKAYDVSLQMAKAQIDEAVTYLTTVFFPEEGAYNAAAPVEKQDAAKALTVLMNAHSAKFKHFRTFTRFATDGFKYNVGFMMPTWTQQFGTVVQNDQAKTSAALVHDQILYEGNALVYADPYNVLYDPSVSPVDVADKGEFFATVEPVSLFELRRAKTQGKLFNADDLETNTAFAKVVNGYYTPKPDITGDGGKGSSANNETDWAEWFTMGNQQNKIGSSEKVKMYIWLPAKQFGLDESESFSIWRFEILNGKRIVNAQQVPNAHGMLPLVACRPWDDNFDKQTQSYAEMLLPYQRFSSFQLNVHQQACRKALYGITLYLDRLMPDIKDADLLACKIPVKTTAELESFDKLFRQFNDVPQTGNTLNDIQSMEGIMQKILPTDMLKQVTDLQRATKYQSAATVQGANRRNLKIAQLIESQAFEPARRMQIYNILQFQEYIEVLDPQTKQPVKIDPAKLRDAKLETVIGAGLRGMDKLILIESLQEMLGYIVQNQQAAQELDVVEIMNYITSLIGDYTNIGQFKYKNEFDKMTPEQKQMAFQLLQKAMQQQAAQQQQGGQPNAAPAK